MVTKRRDCACTNSDCEKRYSSDNQHYFNKRFIVRLIYLKKGYAETSLMSASYNVHSFIQTYTEPEMATKASSIVNNLYQVRNNTFFSLHKTKADLTLA